MLISNKVLAWAIGLGSFALTHALSPMQVAMQHREQEAQGFRILQNENVQGYSVRVKQPKSCEKGVQVKKEKMKLQTNSSTRLLTLITKKKVFWLYR